MQQSSLTLFICSVFRYDRTLKLPFVPGFEVCGEVLEVGSKVSTLTVGSKVIGINKEGLGGFAEECIASEQVEQNSFFAVIN